MTPGDGDLQIKRLNNESKDGFDELAGRSKGLGRKNCQIREQDPEFDHPLDQQMPWRHLDRRQTCEEG